MLLRSWFMRLEDLWRLRKESRKPRSTPRRRVHLLSQPEDWILEDRCMPSFFLSRVSSPSGQADHPIQALLYPFPANTQVQGMPIPLSSIFWNGASSPLGQNGKKNVPAPPDKFFTITNNSNNYVYPFLRAANSGQYPDTNASTGKTTLSLYDPQDPNGVATPDTGPNIAPNQFNYGGEEYRAYIGFQQGTHYFFGLPAHSSITIKVPLVFWDGGNVYFATDGALLTVKNPITDPNPFVYDPNADKLAVSGAPWVQSGSGNNGAILFYHSLTPVTLTPDAPAQLTEYTIRDPYNLNFLPNPNTQSTVLFNYDVSYVDNQALPAAQEADQVPVPDPAKTGTSPTNTPVLAPFGWAGASSSLSDLQADISNFINNTGNASIGTYFAPVGSTKPGPGWPQYYIPTKDNITLLKIPSGENVFANSPLTGQTTKNEVPSNHYILTTAGTLPVNVFGAGTAPNLPLNPPPNPTLVPFMVSFNPTPSGNNGKTLSDMLSQAKATNTLVLVSASYTNSNNQNVQLSGVLTSVDTTTSMATVLLDPGQVFSYNPSGYSLVFTRQPTDYASTRITDVFYAWSQYYTDLYKDFTPIGPVAGTMPGQTTFGTDGNLLKFTNPMPTGLFLGMSVTDTMGKLPADTTILKIDQANNAIYLSDGWQTSPLTGDMFTFSAPQGLPTPLDPGLQPNPITLKFAPSDQADAKLFAASVYEAMYMMDVFGPLPTAGLSPSINLVRTVIGFDPLVSSLGAHTSLTGQIRDVVKSILRGVYDFTQVPQSEWYPDPKTATGGQTFNVYNLDPYVWLVHSVEGLQAYGFSIDDDQADVGAGQSNYDPTLLKPDTLLFTFGGLQTLPQQKQYFQSVNYGSLQDFGTIGLSPDPQYKGLSILTMSTEQKFWQITSGNPGNGQLGPYLSGPGIVAGTTLVLRDAYVKTPGGPTPLVWTLSQPAVATPPNTAALFTLTGQPPTNLIQNPTFAHPPIADPLNPNAANGYWADPPMNTTNQPWIFAGTAGITGTNSQFTKNNPPPPQSTQLAYITGTGNIRQGFTVKPAQAGTYSLRFLAAPRQQNGGIIDSPALAVYLDGSSRPVATITINQQSNAYAAYTTAGFRLTAGAHTIRIAGVNAGQTALLDAVTLAPLPG